VLDGRAENVCSYGVFRVLTNADIDHFGYRLSR